MNGFARLIVIVIASALLASIVACSAAKGEAVYEPVDPAEVRCGMAEFYTQSIVGESEVNGSLGTLICEEKEVALKSNHIVDGVLTTEEFGEIHLEFHPQGIVMFMLKDDMQRLINWAHAD